MSLLYNAWKIQANFYNPTSMRTHLLVLSPIHTSTYMMTPLLLFVITAFRCKLSARGRRWITKKGGRKTGIRREDEGSGLIKKMQMYRRVSWLYIWQYFWKWRKLSWVGPLRRRTVILIQMVTEIQGDFRGLGSRLLSPQTVGGLISYKVSNSFSLMR